MSCFIVCALGFEEQVRNEVLEVWPYLLSPQSVRHGLPPPGMQIHKGGVEVECEFFTAVQFNFFLKTATRVLWRIGDFKVKDFPKLFQKLSSFPWSTYFHPQQKVAAKISAQSSRLGHEKRIEKVLQDVFVAKKINWISFAGSSDKSAHASLYIRMLDDHCWLSLDLSGEPLYKRGWSHLKGEAPLRESIAAWILLQMTALHNFSFLKKVELIDPFCGSGTFLNEAMTMTTPLWSQRNFSFQTLKCVPKLFLSEKFQQNYKLPSPGMWKKLLGFDINKDVLNLAKQQMFIGPSPFHFEEQDFWASENTKPREENTVRWVVGNPPYGERLHWQGSAAVKNGNFTLCDILQQIHCKWNPHKVALLTPIAWAVDRPLPFVLDAKCEVIENGGLKVKIWFFEFAQVVNQVL
ncbi:MAG: hypothetical protein ACOYOK_06020 [Pseudobdellovibrionaceae bacterium]